jgi:hypothetical protein
MATGLTGSVTLATNVGNRMHSQALPSQLAVHLLPLLITSATTRMTMKTKEYD